MFGRLLPYLVIGWLYFATYPYYRGLHNPNEMVRIYMTAAAVEKGTFAIDAMVERWGPVQDKSVREGKLYSGKAPLQSLVGIPALWVGGPWLHQEDLQTLTFYLRAICNQLPGFIFSALLLWGFRRRAIRLERPPAEGVAIGLALALGTMHYPYSLTYTGHLWASLCGGGSFLLLAHHASRDPETRSAAWITVLAGFLAGAAPFAEYPAALIAAPALVSHLAQSIRSQLWVRELGLLAAGGAAPFALGLWTHFVQWGSPFKTGYSFLENSAFEAVHAQGFFGVGMLDIDALWGTLFSPGTGLFFFSPLLAVGLLVLLIRLVQPEHETEQRLALVSLIAVSLSWLFMGAHAGWRGGWTVGPRYIIGVVPILGMWAVEGLRIGWLRPWLFCAAGLSVILTGPASAIYPHLSDEFYNPLGTFLWPAYERAEYSYGVGHWLGLSGHEANALHLVPILGAALWVAFLSGRARMQQSVVSALVLPPFLASVLSIPETDPARARAENMRLEAMWEPKAPTELDIPGTYGPALRRALHHADEISVVRTGPKGHTQACMGVPCHYGPKPWQHFGPEALRFDGRIQTLLFMHPVAGHTVAATITVPESARRAIVHYGLTDESIDSGNAALVKLTAIAGETTLGTGRAGARYGLEQLLVELPNQASSLRIEVQVKDDGARVFAWDVTFHGASGD